MNESREVEKKQSRTDELLTLIAKKISVLQTRLDKVLSPDSPDKADIQEETTPINKGLASIHERLEDLIKRIDL